MNDVHVTRGLGLPTQQEYRYWSKEKLIDRLENDEYIRRIVVYDDKYHFNKYTVAIYDFNKNPIFGKFKAVILDKERGIVLCKKHTKSILHKYTKNVLLSGLSFQKAVARILGLTSYHSISLAHMVFFSLQTYGTKNTDWVGLHFFSDYELLEGNIITFASVEINHRYYTFEFEYSTPDIYQRITDSLTHNEMISRMVHAHLESLTWVCDSNTHDTGSMIFNPDYYREIDKVLAFSFKYFVDQVVHDWHYIYMRCIASEYDMKFLLDEHHVFYRKAQRNRQNY